MFSRPLRGAQAQFYAGTLTVYALATKNGLDRPCTDFGARESPLSARSGPGSRREAGPPSHLSLYQM